ncbi:uncharacterized protein (UPF0548 family) [Stackebrandtia endophytica]|uniref:Uncharacterized protein (UPF0548 family) n=1 Tax=Stackebrandtia endophytica TaxID=1496996 RepID=A0A543B2R0_9ACTN|nr:DUF1990 domain-containing protein [Stackebrandtia endophytica]TQL79135.1 uncharacterized protein (UPF0548 family) [Stackebrandtia endophytica]
MDFTYPHVGITRDPHEVPGYRLLRYRTRLKVGFDKAAEAVMAWQLHRNAGLRPQAAAPRAEPGVVVVSRIGPLRAPCRVVWTVEEPDRVGYGYGTLPGHPVAGEESFLVEHAPDGTVWFTVTAVSRADRWFTRVAGPLVPMAQWLFVRWFARGLNRA